jgi:DNA-binding MarR family transcriptional regulator
MRSIGAAMREHDIELSPHQRRLLSMIESRPRTLSEIADIQGVTRATATTLVTTLEARGWVARNHDVQDRRRVLVTVTDSGSAALSKAQEVVNEAMLRALDPLDDAQVARLLSGLEVVGELNSHPERAHAHGCCAAPEKGGTR